ncbi:MAG TPA: hypothetical protein VIH10_01525 [Kribbella sp.]|jgi:hypothetical protein
MSWQLWVVIALAATGLVLLAVARMRHAREVFDDITQLDRPTWTGHPRVDELARARAQRVRPEPDRHRKHG